MLESVKKYVGEVLSSDPRKRDFGDLEEVKRRRQRQSPMGQRNRVKLGGRSRIKTHANFAGNGSRRMPRKERMIRYSEGAGANARIREPAGGLKAVWKSLKTFFSSEDQDLGLMQKACTNLDSMVSPSKRLSGAEERRQLKERIARSEAFKRKVLQVKYDSEMLKELRVGRSRQRADETAAHNLSDDQVTLLQKKIAHLESELKNSREDLRITQKRLKFANEKNALLESLLDDANIDREYVKSRRDIKNIQRDNLIPESELPPSPRRAVNPLYTSSPMRNGSKDESAAATDFYSKYPKIPETEALAKNQKNDSLSPIRIDYSKYSM
ncbi:hypothetical protein HG536_0F00440 [Torulaspora globosa]|uniref:Uncharacterized protein n=1 Tax=Torulaspora globosa TaxID=48254 RepID=A0A7G3ZJN4_9SACH|nr:uncharacterized protein HG536_0F00440 [Torulaspora globosa]QLL33720.1 hypothetical protein HG536_0F00440 [Torulaspora globosa]